ncbi:protein WVD2-like 7 [Daucus carota subsp. sativus]|uniref:protein WVD2-like 7 n=1 Tax=Daucus carota subsp. sativus TaxID=79200 RepID=UPI0007EFF7D7|nr:PREDICTED: protein WVD2-like 7 [Daucus carota subsp. sativus]
MGDVACVMHPFSYTSGTSDEPHQMNPLHALGESVSFGRFMTDSSLSWEKWSAFTQNRHVEEAERYAQPGSVAEKKAFFEAHYKRIAAAKKAAALLEQENAAKNADETELGSGGCIDAPSDAEKSGLELQEQILIKIKSGKENLMVSAEEDESNSNANYAIPDELGLGMEMDTEAKVLGEIAMNIGSEDPPENFEDKNKVSRLESNLLKDAVQMDRKKRPVLSTLKSSVFRKVTSTPAKSMPPLAPRKENSYTPATIRSTMESTDKKRTTPKSLRRFINFTPTRRPEKLPTPAARKTESSAPDTNFYKANKDCATPSKTPASVSGMLKHPLVTPYTESKRDKELLDPLAPGSKTSGPKWHLLSSVCSKSLSACRKKLQSSTLSTPFTLRTEERAARRKQKLEDRFNEKEAQNVQRQAKLKEKAETEVGKFGPSLCFRARPLPEFYKERETSKKQTKKAPEMHPQTSKQAGKKASSNSIQGTNPFAKSSNNSLRNFLKKNTQE